MPEPWPFCELPAERIVVQNELAFGIRDGFPVTEGHALVFPGKGCYQS
jgi:diadenosine tetraphosphate (Ap4A) HIT family hydrolase